MNNRMQRKNGSAEKVSREGKKRERHEDGRYATQQTTTTINKIRRWSISNTSTKRKDEHGR
jgi:hypothetical protein